MLFIYSYVLMIFVHVYNEFNIYGDSIMAFILSFEKFSLKVILCKEAETIILFA